jgi:hypothetical protein
MSFLATADADREKEFDSFIEEMKTPREEIKTPPVLEHLEKDKTKKEESEPEESAEQSTDEQLSEEIVPEGQSEILDAILALEVIDIGVSYACSAFTGKESERYEYWKGNIPENDRRVISLARIIRKWKVKASPEWVFIMGMFTAYYPIYQIAAKDMKEKKEQSKNQRESSGKQPSSTVVKRKQFDAEEAQIIQEKKS